MPQAHQGVLDAMGSTTFKGIARTRIPPARNVGTRVTLLKPAGQSWLAQALDKRGVVLVAWLISQMVIMRTSIEVLTSRTKQPKNLQLSLNLPLRVSL